MLKLDLSGLNCPLPILKTKKFLYNMDTGSEVEIITTDPASANDLQVFCKKTGHVLLSQQITQNLITTIIKHR